MAIPRRELKKLQEKGMIDPGVDLEVKKRNKYNISKTEDRTVDGIVFDSKLEAHAYAYLRNLIPPRLLHRQVRFYMQPGFTLLGESSARHSVRYTADFVIGRLRENGTPAPGAEVIDMKGMELTSFRVVARIFEFNFLRPIRVVRSVKGLREIVERFKKMESRKNYALMRAIADGAEFEVTGYRASDGGVFDYRLRVIGRHGYRKVAESNRGQLEAMSRSLASSNAPETQRKVVGELLEAANKQCAEFNVSTAPRPSKEKIAAISDDVGWGNDEEEKMVIFRMEILSVTERHPSKLSKTRDESSALKKAIRKTLPFEKFLFRINLFPGKYDSVSLV